MQSGLLEREETGARAKWGNWPAAEALRVLALEGPLTRGQLAERLEVSVTSVGRLVERLQDRGLVRGGERALGATGRPAFRYELAGESGCVVSLHMFRGSVEAAAFDLSWNRLARVSLERPIAQLSREDVLRAVGDAVDRALRAGGLAREKLLAIGCGVWGSVVDGEVATDGTGGSRATLFWPLRRDLRDVPVAGALAARFGVPACVDDTTRYVAWEIRHRRAREANGTPGAAEQGTGGARDFLLVTEAGATAAVLNGDVYRGAGGLGGELTHFPVDPAGRPCQCGNRGCLNTITRAHVLRERIASTASHGLHPALRALLEADSGETGVAAVGAEDARTVHRRGEALAHALRSAADDGDRLAKRIMADVGAGVGTALAAAVNLLGVEDAYVRGPVVGTSPEAQEALREELDRHVVEMLAPRVRVHFLEPREDDGLMGAARRALDVALSSPG